MQYRKFVRARHFQRPVRVSADSTSMRLRRGLRMSPKAIVAKPDGKQARVRVASREAGRADSRPCSRGCHFHDFKAAAIDRSPTQSNGIKAKKVFMISIVRRSSIEGSNSRSM